MENSPLFKFDNAETPEKLLIQMCFHFSVLIEYQLNQLQANVRQFVYDMSNAIQEMDSLVGTEGKAAQELFENLFNQNSNDEGSTYNNRANKRSDDIFAQALQNLNPEQGPLERFNSDPTKPKKASEENNASVEEGTQKQAPQNVENLNIDEPLEEQAPSQASDKIWSDIAKKFEDFCRLEERLRPQVYTMIQSLNFEDIQTQRIEHALAAQKKLNEGIVQFLKKGLSNCTMEEIDTFSTELMAATRKSYTMIEEREIFDQVFINNELNKTK